VNGLVRGTVVEMGGGVYRVRLEDGREVECFLRGRLKQEARSGDRIVVGDAVSVAEREGAEGTIEVVHPRVRELLRRGHLGRKPKVVAANVDRALVVVAVRDPAPGREMVDRFLVLTGASGIPPVLVLNKVDLPGGAAVAEEYARFYGKIGVPVLGVSAVSGEGMEELRRLIVAGRSVIVGPSGVGKSSLLNALDPSLALRTGAVSVRRGTGRHTTVGARLLQLQGGGEVVDTPGFSDAALWEVDPAELAHAFPEFRGRAEGCRFRGCSHVHEPGCAVRAGVADGTIDAGRHASYVRLLEEGHEGRP
jgi:ribosome biogenesis GTPase / thiamine phosphate phosphatase